MNKQRPRLSAALLCLVVAIVGGCNSDEQTSGEQDGHGHGHSHDHGAGPKTLHAGISELREKWTVISTAMDKGEPDTAHDPLHEVGDILAAMSNLAADTDLSEDDWNELNTTVEALMDAFGDIDAAFHNNGDKVAAYESAKSTVEEGVAELEKVLPLLGESEPDDHEDHDDEDDEGDHDDHDEADENSAAPE